MSGHGKSSSVPFLPLNLNCLINLNEMGEKAPAGNRELAGADEIHFRQDSAATLYLDLLKHVLTRSVAPEKLQSVARDPAARTQPLHRALCAVLQPLLAVFGLELARAYSEDRRAQGKDWPAEAETMVGLARLQNLQDCLTDVLVRGVPGDVIETGVWRGGASIFMRAVLKALGDRSRTVWVADSFEGLPRPDGRYAQDAGDQFWTYSDVLAVSLDQVQTNFRRYGLLDDQVRFLKGWFKDTLPSAPFDRFALIRLDGDMYSSTMDSLRTLYPKLSSGGYAVIDDFFSVPACRQAVEDYRASHGIREPVLQIDWSGAYWKKL